MVVVSAGIRPRDELARDCGLATGHRGGIVVNDLLQTEDPAIYAIGECAEHDGTVYGLVAPGIQMANTLSDRFRGADKIFTRCFEATRLKLVGINVVFCGDFLDTSRATILAWRAAQSYVRLIVRRGRLVGMVGVGNIPQSEQLQQAVAQQRRIFWWHIRRFESTGRLWEDQGLHWVASCPESTVICNCHGITRGALTLAQQRGCHTVQQLTAETRAGTACGSCQPLLQTLAGEAPSAATSSRSLTTTTVVSLAALVFVITLCTVSPILQPASVQLAPNIFQRLLANSIFKQFSGYSVLTLTVLSLVISLRKRFRWLSRFTFTGIRTMHVLLVTAALPVLMAHTGFHKGSNLNRLLFVSFILSSLTGSVVGLLAGSESQLPLALRSLRRPMTLFHILCLWPLPVLIIFHVVSVYWF
jgi:nitrite reductase (NADH) large subunit